MVSKKRALGGAALACAACCAPLVVPLVWPALIGAGIVGTGAAGAGWLGGLSLDAILCGGVGLAVLTGGAVWYRQSRKRQAALPPKLTEGARCDLQTCSPHARHDSKHSPSA